MKDPLLFLLLAFVGVFLYLVTFKGVIYPWMLLLMIAISALWYVANNYISSKMVKKSREGEDFFFQKAQMVDETGSELINGALVATKDEIVFCSRKGYWGGVKVVWSVFTSSLSSYSLDYVTEKKKGIILSVKGEKRERKFVSQKISEREEELRKALNWE